MELYFSNAEIKAMDIVLRHAENKAAQARQNIKTNRFMALRYVFNIPLSIEAIGKKAENVLSQEDINLAIDEMNHYLADTDLSKINRHDDLREVIKKLKIIKTDLGRMKRFIPNIDHQQLTEIDLFNLDQGLQRLKDDIEDVVEDNEIHPLFNLFNDELSDEIRMINRLAKAILPLKNIAISRLIEILKAADISDSLYQTDLLISGLNLYEAEQQSWVESKNLLNTRETLLKLFYVRGRLNEKLILKSK